MIWDVRNFFLFCVFQFWRCWSKKLSNWMEICGTYSNSINQVRIWIIFINVKSKDEFQYLSGIRIIICSFRSSKIRLLSRKLLKQNLYCSVYSHNSTHWCFCLLTCDWKFVGIETDPHLYPSRTPAYVLLVIRSVTQDYWKYW